MSAYKIKYRFDIITESVMGYDVKGASSVTFINTGSDNATINNIIPLLATEERNFNNLPNCKIVDPFRITFSSTTAPKILVIMTHSDI